ncbi:hypothetical protein LWI28_004887 [Acer negundo]|uniref:Uncharacterized protein n=1 Tax=Acer negundo TaxID=4023 RepID=A0AAD5NH16_ACENE|nr:hypothetical protein LWI28_004887 [Acer negundo]
MLMDIECNMTRVSTSGPLELEVSMGALLGKGWIDLAKLTGSTSKVVRTVAAKTHGVLFTSPRFVAIKGSTSKELHLHERLCLHQLGNLQKLTSKTPSEMNFKDMVMLCHLSKPLDRLALATPTKEATLVFDRTLKDLLRHMDVLSTYSN